MPRRKHTLYFAVVKTNLITGGNHINGLITKPFFAPSLPCVMKAAANLNVTVDIEVRQFSP